MTIYWAVKLNFKLIIINVSKRRKIDFECRVFQNKLHDPLTDDHLYHVLGADTNNFNVEIEKNNEYPTTKITLSIFQIFFCSR